MYMYNILHPYMYMYNVLHPYKLIFTKIKSDSKSFSQTDKAVLSVQR